MLKDLKSTIQDIKKEALRNLAVTPSPGSAKRGGGRGKKDNVDESEEDNCLMTEDEDEGIEDKSVKRKNKIQQKGTPRGSSSKLNDPKCDGSSNKTGGYQSFFSRPSSIISGLTSIGRSSSSFDGQEKDKGSKEKISSKSESKQSDKKSKKDKATKSSLEKSNKIHKQLTDDFPMMDETVSPRTLSPVDLVSDITDTEPMNENSNFDLGKSTSSPSMSNRPRALNLKSHKSESKANSTASSPDSPTRPSSPFDLPKVQINGRATSPTGFALHRPGSTPGPLNRQGSMSTVPEDRVIDLRTSDSNRPSDPPPPPPTNKIFAISRQNSTPNIATQKLTTPMGLQRQHSLGVVLEESKTISRQGSLLSMPDDRLLVDQTLPMSPTQSLMSFPGSWSTTSLNKPEVNLAGGQNTEEGTGGGRGKGGESPKPRLRGALDLVAGGVLAGSSLNAGNICPLDDTDEGPLATSSLKRRKKAKKDPNVV